MVQLGLMEAAATVICPDHVTQTKPHPEPILLACSEISMAPGDCLYVGDHVRDIESGRAAGTRNIAAAWGYIEQRVNIARLARLIGLLSDLSNCIRCCLGGDLRHTGESQYLFGSQRNSIDPSLRWGDVL